MQNAMSEPVLLERQGGVVIITLNRPDQANVLSDDMARSMVKAIDQVTRDTSARCVLIAAKGRHFCAGGNIADFARAGDDLGSGIGSFLPELQNAILRLASLPVPVISALNGPIGGGGIGVALCADIVLAAESMKLRGGYSAIGLTPDIGVSWFLTRLVGPMRAKQILFTNEAWDARQCLAAGIVAVVHPDDQLERAALELATRLSQGSTGSLARIKDLVDGTTHRSFAEQLELEVRYMGESAASADAREGVRAFMEKRAPVFGSSS